VSGEIDRRRYPRLSTTGKPYGVRFEVQGQEIRDARLANLSACGCGLEIQIGEAADLESGALLQKIILEHPDLPTVPLDGVVVRVLGKVPGKTAGYVLVGVDFTSITPLVQTLINDHVLAEHAGL
jgi:c-di-GMP-binding flagellar brake protein YcgR